MCVTMEYITLKNKERVSFAFAKHESLSFETLLWFYQTFNYTSSQIITNSVLHTHDALRSCFPYKTDVQE